MADKEDTPMWVKIAKAVVYILGLFLAGYGTSASAHVLGII